ncbi:hypothetical protein V6N13_075415 [Hibiscus sabdariffa]|uniref:Uncharacterized protein n=1 Tax=Hibiscus sabdariffa TaxID=183260 RepID=A0ABR2UBP9_9ROSI
MKLRRPSTKGISGCRRHPKHRQSPGVCSVCLVEKLSKLPAPCTAFATTTVAASKSNCSSYSSSSSSSSSSSPMHRFRFSRDEGKGSSFSFSWFSGKNLLTRSRSVTSVSRIKSKDCF